MSIILDIVAVAIILICGITSLKQGAMAKFIKSVAPLFSAIAAFSGAKSLGVHFNGLAKKIAPETEAVHEMIQFALGFVVIFVVAMLVLFIIRKLFTWVNSLIDKIPGLGTVNKIVNVVLGLLIGYFNANFFVYVMRAIGLFVESIEVGLIDTAVCKFIADHSIFEFVVEKIAGLFA